MTTDLYVALWVVETHWPPLTVVPAILSGQHETFRVGFGQLILAWWKTYGVCELGLFDAKPLPKPMLPYSELNTDEYISMEFYSTLNHLHWRKCIWESIYINPFHPPGEMAAILADDIFRWIFWNENGWIPFQMSLKFVPKRPINNTPALVEIMAWHRRSDKPLSWLS